MVINVHTIWLFFLQCLCWFNTVTADVQFNFSTSELGVSEGGDLPSLLSIVKTGQQDEGVTITLRVRITSDTANNNDYVPNEDHEYVFTRDVTELPIATTLGRDRSGEGIESFNITLLQPEADNVQIVSPSVVTVIIIDDDSVVIGFSDSNTSLTFVEGGPSQVICANVKPEGLELDPFDIVPLNIQLTGLENDVMLPVDSLTFTRDNMLRCKTISVTDNDVSDGTRSADLILTNGPMTTVPVEIYPNKIPLMIMDNDVTNFTLRSPSSISLLEGQLITGVITIEKSNNTVLAYTVTLTDSADLAIAGMYTFDPTITDMDIPLEATDNSIFSEQPKEILIDIVGVEAVDVIGALTSVGGTPAMITIYENDFKVGFTESEITLSDGDSNHTVCVEMFDVAPEDVMPGQNLNFSVSVSPSSTHRGSIELGLIRIMLNATDRVVCFDVRIKCVEEVCESGNFIIELMNEGNEGYNISFQQRNITFSQNIAQQGLSAGGIAAIVIVVLGVTIVIITIAIVGSVFAVKRRLHGDNKNLSNNKPEKTEPSPNGTFNMNSEINGSSSTSDLNDQIPPERGTAVDSKRGLRQTSSTAYLIDQ